MEMMNMNGDLDRPSRASSTDAPECMPTLIQAAKGENITKNKVHINKKLK